MVNMIWRSIWSLDEQENNHFDIEEDIHISSEKYDANVYGYIHKKWVQCFFLWITHVYLMVKNIYIKGLCDYCGHFQLHIFIWPLVDQWDEWLIM